MQRPPRRHACRGVALALPLVLALAGCGKVADQASDKVAEKATEKLLEAQINKDGANAKVDLSKGGATVEGTDEHGKAFKMEMGSAQLGEADIGIPFYPGAKPVEQGGTRIRNGEVQMASLELDSSAAPKLVSAWYRDKLKASGEGRMVIDNASEDQGMQLSIIDSKTQENISVTVAAQDGGSRITLMHSTAAK